MSVYQHCQCDIFSQKSSNADIQNIVPYFSQTRTPLCWELKQHIQVCCIYYKIYRNSNIGIKEFYSNKNVTSNGAEPDDHWIKSSAYPAEVARCVIVGGSLNSHHFTFQLELSI